MTKQENQNEKTASSSHGNFYAKHFCRSSSAKIFWGNWASVEKPDQCDIPKGSPIDFPESGLKIGADGISQYEAGCSVVKIINSTEKSITAKFECGDTERAMKRSK
ncbi:MAG: hypothetical protein IPK95_10575 [Cellvibrionales bacterium]|nr:hypothetical protein [Cellvibrionales bacterium]